MDSELTYRGAPVGAHLSELPKESGVQELIDRLRIQGIEAGQQEAAALIEAARTQARSLVTEARHQADTIRKQAEEDAQRTRTAGEEALRLAARDVILSLKNQITGLVRQLLSRQVREVLDQPAFLEQLLLTIAQRQAAEMGASLDAMLVLPPVDTAGPDSPLNDFLTSLLQEAMQSPMPITRSDQVFRGLKVQMNGGQLTVDFTDQALSELLMQYLLPRFRAILEGQT